MGIGTISPKMVESQLEGDEVVDLDFTTLWAWRVLDLKLLPSTSCSSISLLVFFSNGGYPGFLPLHLVVAGWEG